METVRHQDVAALTDEFHGETVLAALVLTASPSPLHVFTNSLIVPTSLLRGVDAPGVMLFFSLSVRRTQLGRWGRPYVPRDAAARTRAHDDGGVVAAFNSRADRRRKRNERGLIRTVGFCCT